MRDGSDLTALFPADIYPADIYEAGFVHVFNDCMVSDVGSDTQVSPIYLLAANARHRVAETVCSTGVSTGRHTASIKARRIHPR